jgi:hypothetical protein
MLASLLLITEEPAEHAQAMIAPRTRSLSPGAFWRGGGVTIPVGVVAPRRRAMGGAERPGTPGRKTNHALPLDPDHNPRGTPRSWLPISVESRGDGFTRLLGWARYRNTT